MAKSLADRLKAALAANARASDVAQLIQIVTDELAAAEVDLIRFHADAIDVGSTDAAADEAADAENRTARRIVRLKGQTEQLKARLAEIVAADERREQAAAWSIVIAERDQLAADLAAEWPLIEAKIQSLLWRLVISDKRCGTATASAEAIARGCNAAFNYLGAPVHRLTSLRLPAFDASGPMVAPAWPPHHKEHDWALMDRATGDQMIAAAAERVASLEPQRDT